MKTNTPRRSHLHSALSKKQFPVRTACAARLRSLLLSLLLALPAVGQAQFNYTTNNNGSLTITGYTGPGGAVAIPNTINGRAVTRIGEYAFHNRTSLTSVTIPDSVTDIGNSAFSSCASLTSVTIGSGVASIHIGVFSLCTSLSAITVDALNSVYSSVDGVLFNKSQTALIQYPGGKTGSYTIPNSVTYIGGEAFWSCTGLTSVMIPNSVTGIEVSAFAFCTSLASVTIGNGVITIGASAFYGCTSLTNVVIPDSVTSFVSDAFSYCTSLSAITVDALNSVYSSVDGVLFNKSQTLLITFPGGKAGSYTIPNSVASIGVFAFAGCTSLASVTIPNSVTNLGDCAFQFCTRLTSVAIPNSVTSIGYGAFDSCASLTSVTVPGSVTNIGDHAFQFCTNLAGVYFQGNAPSVGSDVFTGANNVTVYYLPGTTGWGTTFAGRPAVLWNPLVSTSDASFGVRTNRFGFTITGASNLVIVVEAATNLANPAWTPVGTNTLTGGSSYFSDPQWTNYPARFYRLRSP
jgi:BspA type Leucine rich repeat region (6 copies)